MTKPLVSIIIPRAAPRDRDIRDAEISLAADEHPDKQFIVVEDFTRRGASWARNRGWRAAQGQYLLFSDCDCTWEKGALVRLLECLESDSAASYAYCGLRLIGCGIGGLPVGKIVLQCLGPFLPEQLQKGSLISTMSLFRAEGFPGFDENLQRLQDWDLYLTLLERDGRLGVCLPELLFSMPARPGMTYGDLNPVSCERGYEIVNKKHGL